MFEKLIKVNFVIYFMPFLRRAQEFLANQGSLSNHKYRDIMVETVDYLLKNAVGVNNAVSTDSIISHLRSRGFNISREEWQINVLGVLREHGIFIGSKRGVGMFLIASEDDAREAHNSILDRVLVECERLKILRELIKEAGWKL